MPDFHLQFHLYVDASNEGIGMILGQIQNNREVAIAYGGRKLNPAERNYSATEREALAVVAAIKHFQPYLHGRPFIVHTIIMLYAGSNRSFGPLVFVFAAVRF